MAPRNEAPTRAGAKRRQLPDQVAGYVREQIMTGRMRPGDFLRMEPIAEAVGVSITPVREGLLTLRSEGFVTLVPRRGFQVAAFTRQDVRDLFWTLSQLSGELSARAVKKATPELVARLREINESTTAAARAGDTARVGDLGHEFHRQINLAAESDRLTRLLMGVVKHLPNRFYAALESDVESLRAHHDEIVDAFEVGDARRVRRAMEQHLTECSGHVVAMLEGAGLWAEE
ncbi:GntR family transcriptional regulator [Tsukamurella sp. 1534]|uniref:GntR family transcriptional regulator n=1 Tax=Tsukamurella sp. 1534 TaxID=1151061 RepID=UPI00031F2717|nr:GntR family transcriptional regulator [Tsukamurella sp. 1534]